MYVQEIPASVRAAINSRTKAVFAKRKGETIKPEGSNVSQFQKVESASA